MTDKAPPLLNRGAFLFLSKKSPAETGQFGERADRAGNKGWVDGLALREDHLCDPCGPTTESRKGCCSVPTIGVNSGV